MGAAWGWKNGAWGMPRGADEDEDEDEPDEDDEAMAEAMLARMTAAYQKGFFEKAGQTVKNVDKYKTVYVVLVRATVRRAVKLSMPTRFTNSSSLRLAENLPHRDHPLNG